MATKKPTKVTIHMYNVGFGDCFLLKFHYGSDAQAERRMLIDFGSTKWPKGSSALAVANDIKKECGPSGKLHVVVATHRHKDHISGFATTAKGDGPGDIIASLKPDLVVQPWTEIADLPGNAEKPFDQSFALQLKDMHAISAAVPQSVRHLRRGENREMIEEIDFIADDNLTNRAAVENLARMGGRGKYKPAFVSTGKDISKETLMPGVKIHVLGPPTIADTATITKMTATQKDEFWKLQKMSWRTLAESAAVSASGGPPNLGMAPVTLASAPISARWLIRQMREARTEMTLGIVRRLDKQMNNTSIILLIQAGSKTMLFPGDAQWENWEYVLTNKKFQKYQAMLKDVDLYKVGHHGSTNATPKRSLWDKFAKKGKKSKNGRMDTLLSTLKGKHHNVPRSSLVNSLRGETNLLDTEHSTGMVITKILSL